MTWISGRWRARLRGVGGSRCNQLGMARALPGTLTQEINVRRRLFSCECLMKLTFDLPIYMKSIHTLTNEYIWLGLGNGYCRIFKIKHKNWKEKKKDWKTKYWFGYELTIIHSWRRPLCHRFQTRLLPKSPDFFIGVLQTLLNLNSLAFFHQNTTSWDILFWRVKCLVTTAFVVMNILANNFPVIDIEDFLIEDSIGVFQPIEDES